MGNATGTSVNFMQRIKWEGLGCGLMVVVWPMINGLLAILLLKFDLTSNGTILRALFCSSLIFLALGMKLISRRSRRVKAEALAATVGAQLSAKREEPKKSKSIDVKIEEELLSNNAQEDPDWLMKKALYLFQRLERSHPSYSLLIPEHKLRIEVVQGKALKITVFQTADDQEFEVLRGCSYREDKVIGYSYFADEAVYDATIDRVRLVKDVFHKIPDRIVQARQEIELFKPGPWQGVLLRLYAKTRAQEIEKEDASAAASLAAAAAREAGSEIRDPQILDKQ
jgi:hypothetical protein